MDDADLLEPEQARAAALGTAEAKRHKKKSRYAQGCHGAPTRHTLWCPRTPEGMAPARGLSTGAGVPSGEPLTNDLRELALNRCKAEGELGVMRDVGCSEVSFLRALCGFPVHRKTRSAFEAASQRWQATVDAAAE